MKSKSNKFLAISTHIYPTQGFGGPSISFRVIIDFLNSKNISYSLLSTTSSKTYLFNNNGNCEYFFQSYFQHKLGFAPLLFLKFLSLLRSHNGFIINGLTTFPNFCGLLVAFIFKRKVIILPRGGLEFGRTADWSKIKKIFFKIQLLLIKSLNVSGLLYLIYATESEMSKCLLNNSKNKSVVPNILPSFFDVAKKNKKNKDIDLLYVGRYSKEKGIDRLLDLLSKHQVLENKVIYLVFSGLESNQYKSICKIVDGLDCTVLINLERKELLKIYSRSKILYFPSYIENFGNVLVEAVAYDVLPIVHIDTHWNYLINLFGVDLEYLINILDGSINISEEMIIKIKENILNNYILPGANNFDNSINWLYEI